MHQALVERPSSSIHRLAGGERRLEVRFSRFLRHPQVSPEAIFADAAAKTGGLAQGRHVVAFHDSSDLVLGGAKRKRQGFGPVGKGGSTRGLKLHAMIAVDAKSSQVLGLASGVVWNRTGGKATARAKRAPSEKESQAWNDAAVAASQALSQAASLTLVSDRESDIYADYARRPGTVELLVRARHNRCLADGGKLYDRLAGIKPIGSPVRLRLPARPGQKPRTAKLEVRFCHAEIKAPHHGTPPQALRQLPKSFLVYAVEVRENQPPNGASAIHWRLISTQPVRNRRQALHLVSLYRKRWAIEEYFHCLKAGGIGIEEAMIGEPEAMMTFTAAAAVAAASVLKLIKAHDNPQGQAITAVFEPDDCQLLDTITARYEGPHPTQRQRNPHPKRSLAYATWIIGRLGGWTGYYDKPGPKTLNRGLHAFHLIKHGATLRRRDM